MSLRTCQVSCKDLDGVEHSVEVFAESLYEAVARGISALRVSPWVDRSVEFSTIIVTVLDQPAVTHKVHMKDLRRWLDSRGTSPAQITAKNRVREILGPEPTPSDRAQRRRWQDGRNALRPVPDLLAASGQNTVFSG